MYANPWPDSPALFFFCNGAIYPYDFHSQSLNLDSFLCHCSNSTSFIGLLYDFSWCKTRIEPFCPSRFLSRWRMTEKHTKWQPHYHVPCYHNKKTTSLAATWQSTRAFPPAIVSPETITEYYHSQGKCFIRVVLQLLKHSWTNLWLALWFYPHDLCHRKTLELANPDLHHCFSLQADYRLDASQILCNNDQGNMAHLV